MLYSVDLDKLCVLGKGSGGTVFLVCAIDDESISEDLIAVKSAIHRSANSLIRERLVLEELENCPEIVRFLGSKETVELVGFKKQKYYSLLLEYAPGGTLGDVIRRRRRLTETSTSCYTRMILKGLRDVHAKGIVHCDLKPDNILAFPGEETHGGGGGPMKLKLADFGHAKLDGEDDEWHRKFRGTAAYMSPESVREGIIGPALDIWSLGCIVVEMFTGEKAMKMPGADLEGFAEEVGGLKRSPVIPEDMSECGKDFLRKCVASDPAERWTAEMLLDHEFICGIGIGSSTSTSRFFLPSDLVYALNLDLKNLLWA